MNTDRKMTNLTQYTSNIQDPIGKQLKIDHENDSEQADEFLPSSNRGW